MVTLCLSGITLDAFEVVVFVDICSIVQLVVVVVQ